MILLKMLHYCFPPNPEKVLLLLLKGKGKMIPLQARCGPEGG